MANGVVPPNDKDRATSTEFRLRLNGDGLAVDWSQKNPAPLPSRGGGTLSQIFWLLKASVLALLALTKLVF